MALVITICAIQRRFAVAVFVTESAAVGIMIVVVVVAIDVVVDPVESL